MIEPVSLSHSVRQITPNRMLEMLKDPATSDKMMKAMMTMKKIDLKTLEDAVAQ